VKLIPLSAISFGRLFRLIGSRRAQKDVASIGAKKNPPKLKADF